MNPKNSEIFPELILPLDSIVLEDFLVSGNFLASEDSLVSEDFLASEDSLVSEDFLASGDSLVSENNFTSEYSLAPQQIDVDPLTRMAKDPIDPRNENYFTTLTGARLHIDRNNIWSGSDEMRVTVTVKVELSNSYTNRGGSFILQSRVLGIDYGFDDRRKGYNGPAEEDLFDFPDQMITQSGTYSFSTVVPSSVLDEDNWRQRQLGNRDEIQASITLATHRSIYPVSLNTMTNLVREYF
jgi:hypothetical protein